MAKKTSAGPKVILVNRAPVLMLWAAAVAERLGFDRDEALSLGKAVAVLNAQSKGRRLGILHAKPDQEPAPKKLPPDERMVELCGRSIPVIKTGSGSRAVVKGETVSAEPVKRYLFRSFGDALPAAEQAMRDLAKSQPKAVLRAAAYGMYEQFRPTVPPGARGWGAKGTLDLNLIRSLASTE